MNDRREIVTFFVFSSPVVEQISLPEAFIFSRNVNRKISVFILATIFIFPAVVFLGVVSIASAESEPDARAVDGLAVELGEARGRGAVVSPVRIWDAVQVGSYRRPEGFSGNRDKQDCLTREM